MADKKMMEKMKKEALQRMELLGLERGSVDEFLEGELTKTYTNHDEKRVYVEELTIEEKSMIQKIESENDILVFYVMQDEGVWPDGCKFSRYTLPYVSVFEDDYEMIKENCIGLYQTLPAYVVNMEEMKYSGKEEICYHVVGGKLINIS